MWRKRLGWEIPMFTRLEILISKLLGKVLLNDTLQLHQIIYFFLILILVFVSRMLVRTVAPRWATHIFTVLTVLVVFSSFVTTAEGSPGPGNSSEPEHDAAASGSGTEALVLGRQAMEHPTGRDAPSEAGPSGSASESWQKYLNLSEENAASEPSSHAPSNPDPELGEEVQQVSPPHYNVFQVQHQCIKNRLSASGRDLGDDEIDTIISLKKEIIDRMAQLDPDQDGFWIEQKNHLVAHGILKDGAEYTLPGLERLLNLLMKSCAHCAVFKRIKRQNKF